MREGYKVRKIVAEVSQVMVRLERNWNARLKGLVLTLQLWRRWKRMTVGAWAELYLSQVPMLSLSPMPSV